MSKHILIALVICLSCLSLLLEGCYKDQRFQSLRWPPDTLKFVHIKRPGHKWYTATTAPAAKDPVFDAVIWPPDTTDLSAPSEIDLIWVPDTTSR